MVEGAEKERTIPIGRSLENYKDTAQFTEPSVVVEIAYDDISPHKQRTLGFSFVEGSFRAIPPPVAINALINAKIQAS